MVCNITNKENDSGLMTCVNNNTPKNDLFTHTHKTKMHMSDTYRTQTIKHKQATLCSSRCEVWMDLHGWRLPDTESLIKHCDSGVCLLTEAPCLTGLCVCQAFMKCVNSSCLTLICADRHMTLIKHSTCSAKGAKAAVQLAHSLSLIWPRYTE